MTETAYFLIIRNFILFARDKSLRLGTCKLSKELLFAFLSLTNRVSGQTVCGAQQESNEPTPAHRHCIRNSSHRFIPQRAEQAPPPLHTTQSSPHILHRPRPRRST